jgi:hypothetical protein
MEPFLRDISGWVPDHSNKAIHEYFSLPVRTKIVYTIVYKMQNDIMSKNNAHNLIK